MGYRTRLLIAVAVMCVGAAAAGIVLWHDAFAAVPTSAADVRARVCANPVSTSVAGTIATFRQNGLVAGSIFLGGLTLGLRLVSQLLYIGFDFADLYVTAIRQSESHGFAIAGLLPHGIPELGAFAAVGATGIQVASLLLRALMRRGRPTWVESDGSASRAADPAGGTHGGCSAGGVRDAVPHAERVRMLKRDLPGMARLGRSLASWTSQRTISTRLMQPSR